jgi:3-dehydroquinate dehydratase type I
MTRICVSIIENNLSDLMAGANEAKSKGAEMIEVRLDHLENDISESVFDDLLKLRKEVDLPFIITIRPISEGGHFSGDEGQRLQFLNLAIEKGFDIIDLEYSIDEAKKIELLKKAKDHKVSTIISSHNFTSPPSKEEIFERITACFGANGDFAKLVVPCNSLEDVNDILWAAKEAEKVGVEHCIMGTGSKGHISRILAPYYGCELVYCSLSESKRVAEGQVPVSILKEIWKNLDV